MPPYAVRIRTATGWQDIALSGPPGPPGGTLSYKLIDYSQNQPSPSGEVGLDIPNQDTTTVIALGQQDVVGVDAGSMVNLLDMGGVVTIRNLSGTAYKAYSVNTITPQAYGWRIDCTPEGGAGTLAVGSCQVLFSVTGDQGDPGVLAVYEQPGAPSSPVVGSVWVDTDDLPPAGSSLPSAMDPWHLVGGSGEPAFQFSWTNYSVSDDQAGFRKLPDGRVILKGLVKGGGQAAIFTLPPGYRPKTAVYLPLFRGDGYGSIVIQTDGSVLPLQAGGASYVSLQNVEFDTESVLQYVVPTGQGPPLVNVLPTNPTDGQEVHYLADTNSGIVWHLRYRATAFSSYKWEYIGGAELAAGVVAGSSRGTINVYGPLNDTASPTITIPLAGEYVVQGSCGVSANAGTPTGLYSIQVSLSTDIVAIGGVFMNWYCTAVNQESPMLIRSLPTFQLNAGVTIRMLYYAPVTSATFLRRSLSVRPVRVSG